MITSGRAIILLLGCLALLSSLALVSADWDDDSREWGGRSNSYERDDSDERVGFRSWNQPRRNSWNSWGSREDSAESREYFGRQQRWQSRPVVRQRVNTVSNSWGKPLQTSTSWNRNSWNRNTWQPARNNQWKSASWSNNNNHWNNNNNRWNNNNLWTGKSNVWRSNTGNAWNRQNKWGSNNQRWNTNSWNTNNVLWNTGRKNYNTGAWNRQQTWGRRW